MENLKDNKCAIIANSIYYDRMEFKREGLMGCINMDKEPNIRIARSLYRISDNQYLVSLGIRSTMEGEYTAVVDVAGDFEISKQGDPLSDQEIEKTLSHSIMAILFPYAREKISSITSQPYTTPTILPPVNVESFLTIIPIEHILDAADANTSFSKFTEIVVPPNGMSEENMKLRNEIVKSILNAKPFMRIRSDESIVMAEETFKDLAKLISDLYNHARYGDDFKAEPYTPMQIDTIMEFVNIPIKFLVINDSERAGKISYVISFKEDIEL